MLGIRYKKSINFALHTHTKRTDCVARSQIDLLGREKENTHTHREEKEVLMVLAGHKVDNEMKTHVPAIILS